MPIAKTQPLPSFHTWEVLLDEMVEICQKWERLRAKQGKLRKGSETYFDLMSDLFVTTVTLHAKAESIMREHETITDALPDDD